MGMDRGREGVEKAGPARQGRVCEGGAWWLREWCEVNLCQGKSITYLMFVLI